MNTTGNEREGQATDRPAPESARLPFADAVHFSEALTSNPFLAQPAAAMAAATAIGFGIASQMANAFFGVMQTALEATNRQASQTPEAQPAGQPVAPAPVPRDAVVETPSAPVPKAKALVRKKPTAVEVKPKPKSAPKVAKAKAPVPGSVSDDLKRISGIGPKLERVLKDLGVASVSQIATWTDEDVVRFDKQLGFEGRIGRDDWVGQAKALLK